ncbi:MAG TPA: DUF2085 domain-containing protein [Pyrinomonadaceae bacterium]|nr:DUF2085 domain-containing protein [Pyrinomonadaceae bacterium]
MLASVEQAIQYRTPEAGSLRRPLLVWSITAALVLLYVSLIAIAPLALSHGHDNSAFVLYQMFSRVCHQIPERAFYLAGHPLAVCARCTGIYSGFAAGVLVYPLVRSLRRGDTPARKWLLLAAVPTLFDFALGFFGVVANTHWSRSLTGALLGGAAAFYVVPGLMDLSRMTFGRQAGSSTALDGVTQVEGVMRNE